MRGYFAIGIYNSKTKINIGTLWRSAYIFGASYIFTIGRRYKEQASDTIKTHRHIPLFNYLTFDDFLNNIPYNCQIICVELTKNSSNLIEFSHPERAVYLLGPEDGDLPENLTNKYHTIKIPTVKNFCLNVSIAGSIIMYDRFLKNEKKK